MSAIALRGPAWVTVRQHRRPLWVALALLVLSAGTVVALRVWTASRQAKCPDGDITVCGDDIVQYSDAQSTSLWAMEYGAVGMLLIALLVAVFVAGPMVARDLESGTYKMLWTQSMTPRRWLTAKLAVPAIVVLVGVAVLTVVYRWGWMYLAKEKHIHSWYEPHVYLAIGPVSVAYALLAVAVGALVGLLVRRTVPAMAVTALVTGAVMVMLANARSGFWTTRTISGPNMNMLGTPEGAFPVAEWMTNAEGGRISGAQCWNDTDINQCYVHHGITGFREYHPASHFWPLQLVETGIVLALAALLTAAAFYVLRRRSA
ncbi:ABC transporter permease [Streptomyces sp. ISL-100]|uniref:ABC transporter permease n=1 Tax=Streptomyces sp. ISL-100 TaxID=2819173 RepID=UPI001BE511F9|nr:ABC transporter permease [Streptomyces sp. ISL-100]MBT2401106.1 ABC transporter permease [Streptomyces sp. ISL-100]